MSIEIKATRVEDLSSNDYFNGNDSISSSGLKLLLDDPKKFYHKYILKDLKESSQSYFDLGNAIHCKVLEPAKFDEQVVLYDKSIDYKKLPKDGKIYLGNMASIAFDRSIKSIESHKPSLEKLNVPGYSEVSFFAILDGIKVKIRPDLYSSVNGFILDIKTTSVKLENKELKAVIDKYSYDLSAALYLDVLNMYYGTNIEEFYWLFTSTVKSETKLLKANKDLIEQGRKKYKKALQEYKKYMEEGWNFKDFNYFEIIG